MPSTLDSERKKVTVQTIHSRYRKKIPITMLTAYDYPTALTADRAETDVLLVGDSLAMVALGYDNTSKLTVDEMIHHCKAVARGCDKAFKVADMTTGSYQISPEQALTNGFRIITEGSMEALKLEGGVEIAETIHRMTQAGIPIMGHIGLTPQHENALGGFRVQGKSAKKAEKILKDALALQQAGCFSIVIECVPSPVAETITSLLRIPTIGIGAGPHTSGQVLVSQDMLGIFDRFVPKFCKQYGQLGNDIISAYREYNREVREGIFPDANQHTYPMSSEKELDEWLSITAKYQK
ncbi:cell wall biogenesis and architecture protein [Dispira simplex]|nr:cell wall biogenesis and architecture protein [Dispira simplex]